MADLTDIPLELHAGDLWTWTKSLSDYPATTHTLIYYFSSGKRRFSITATADGDDHLISEAAADTADRDSGQYNWIARVDDISTGLVIDTLERGLVKILPNIALDEDHRTHAQRVLDDLNATIENRAKSGDVLNYSIGGRSRTFRSWEEIIDTRNHYQRLVAQEQGLRPGRVGVRWGAPG